MSQDRDALFLELLRSRGLDRPGDAPISRSQREERVLSLAQERLWFLEQLQPGQATYHMPLAYRLTGELDADVLRAAMEDVVGRHEALRSAYPSVAGRPRQIVVDGFRMPWSVVDVSGLAEEDVLLRAEEETRTAFDLTTGPLLRSCLLRLAPAEHILVTTVHHIVFDGWSMGTFMRELARFLAARSSGSPATLPDLPIQFSDFAEWQRDQLSGGALDEMLGYWRDRLADAPPVLQLPTDRPRPAVQTHRGTHESAVVPADLANRLREVCSREGVTLFMLLLAAFKVVLARYTGQHDIVVGTPIANRNRVEIEPLIGFFVNTLVLRTDLGGDPTVPELLDRVRDTALSAYANQELPFARLVEDLQPERDLSRTPLVQVLFALSNTPDQVPELPGLTTRALTVEPGVAKFDLSMFLTEDGDELTCGIEYATDLFDAGTIRRFWGHYLTVLRSVAGAGQDTRLSELDMIPAAERALMRVGWQTAEPAWAGDECLHQLFEAQADRTPDAVALVFRDTSLTYGRLEDSANRIAQWLIGRGAGPGSVVGLLLDRSPEMVSSLLGVLKAGAAYLPMDPAHPQSRIEYTLTDAGVHLVLTQEHLAGRLPRRVRTLRVDRADLEPADRPLCPVATGDLAYVIYTSGSTGNPKGVMIEHRAIVNLVRGLATEVGLSEEDRLLAVTTLAFDISAFEVFGPLSVGASVVIADGDQTGDLLGPLIDTTGVSVMQATPSLWRMLLDSGWQGAAGLRVLCGGEALPPELLDRLLPVVGPVWNVYGPTETTVWSLSTPLSSARAPIPIGRPIAGTRVHVVDAALNLMPAGVPGELLIGGPGLARGYVNLPALTADRFVPDPFGEDDRLYRTGDIVRYRVDGSLEFLGRADHQVKLRGYRIELSEIESVLCLHQNVGAAAAVLRSGDGQEPRIAGYCTTHRPGTSIAELRQWLTERLPEYMVPAVLVQLDALPMTANGKLDRAALPEPGRLRPDLDGGYLAPRSETEHRLVAMFADVLDLPADEVGAQDDFFSLGGQSLLAVALIARIRDAFDVDLPLSALFAARTAAGLAPHVGESKAAEPEAEAAPDDFDLFTIPRAPRDQPLPLAPTQERLWFFEKLRSGTAAYNSPLVHRLRGDLDVTILHSALNDIAARHESLRSAFPSVAGRPRQVVLPDFRLPWDVVDVGGLSEQDVIGRAETEIRLPFDLSTGPLVRTCLLRVSPDDHILVINAHHIVFDGWSMGVFMRELAEFYAARSAGRPPELPDLAIQYGDFAAWQREWLSGDVLEDLLDYWRDRLAGAPPVLELPADRPRPAVQSHRGTHESAVIPADLVDELREVCAREGLTMYMVLLAAFKILLARYTGQHDIVVGTPIANRTRVELEPLIGFFVNTLVLRTDLDGDPTVTELLDRVRDTALGAYANQDLTFAELVKALRPPRDPSRSPLVQVMFALANTPDQEPELPGLATEPLDIEPGVARFDLSLILKERGDEIAVALEYCTDLFEAGTAQRVLRDYGDIVAAIVRKPDAPISTLAGVTA